MNADRSQDPKSSGVEPALVGWMVDAQVDFMDPAGRLYVRDLFDETDAGSAQVIPVLERVLAWMKENCDIIVFTGDWHGLEDAEIDPVAPDPAMNTYPPHCMGRSFDQNERAGAEIIEPLRPVNPLVLTHDSTPGDALAVAARAIAEQRSVFVRKTKFNVFDGNPGCEAFIAALEKTLARPLQFVVAGIARDVCMTQAVDGLLDRSYPVFALRDATWGLGLEPEETTLARWAERGSVITTHELDGLSRSSKNGRTSCA